MQTASQKRLIKFAKTTDCRGQMNRTVPLELAENHRGHPGHSFVTRKFAQMNDIDWNHANPGR